MSRLGAVFVLMTLAAATACGGNRVQDEGTGQQIPEPQEAGSLPLVAIAQLLADEAWEGDRVQVRGTCIGYSRVLAVGPQPRTRSDWQLMADEVAIWVVGPYPQGCSGSSPATEPATFVMEVAADTLLALGRQQPRRRQYLLYSPSSLR